MTLQSQPLPGRQVYRQPLRPISSGDPPLSVRAERRPAVSGDAFRDAIYEAVAPYIEDNCGPFQHMDIVDALFDMPEMQAMLAKDAEIERLRAEVSRMDCTCLPYAEPHDGMCSRCMALRGLS